MEIRHPHPVPTPSLLSGEALDRLPDEELLALVLGRTPGMRGEGPYGAEGVAGGVADGGAVRSEAGPGPEARSEGMQPMRVARDLLAVHGPLRRLSTRSVAELRAAASLDASQAHWLSGIFALARRIMESRLPAGAPFLSPGQIFDHFHGRLRDHKREMFLVVLLDARHRVLREEAVSEGSLTSSIVHPREVFRAAVRESAGAVVLVHNHPSGDPAPSEEDVAVTRRLVQASELIGIRILDHVIVGDGSYTSFKEAGLL